ncbi:MAG: ribosomal RNA small subunit methyltransferase A [Synergistaceae bacterium]|nr:ribosomal RNA small subunit methyltransferase A [Synergistaceae bacterium]
MKNNNAENQTPNSSFLVPKKRFGQNFLIDKNILDFIISRADLNSQDCVLEIGPGHGVLTRALLAENISCLHAIELDERLKPELEKLENAHENFHIYWDDAVKFDYESLNPFPNKVVANIPYNITTPLIWNLLKFSQKGLRYFLFMLQKEAALRITAPADSKARYPLGVTIEAAGRASIVKNVSRNCFRPVPNVDSALVEIVIDRNFEILNNPEWSELLHQGFSHRRKTLFNNLKNYENISDIKLREIFASSEIDLNIRAEDLTCEQWLKIYFNEKLGIRN